MIAAWKGSLVYLKTDLERQSQTATITSLEIEGNLATVTAELAAPGTVIAAFPPGPTSLGTS